MEPFAIYGQFWLPDEPDRRVPGELVFAESLSVTLDDSLMPYAPLEQGQPRRRGRRTRHAIVHGLMRDGREATLLDVRGVDASTPYGKVTEVHHAKAALLPGLMSQDLFVKAVVQLDGMQAWADPAPMSQEQGGPDDALLVRTDRVVLAEAEHDSRTIRLVVDVRGLSGGDEVRLRQVCMLEVEGPPDSLSNVVDTWVRPLQDFLVVALGSPARLSSLHVQPVGSDSHSERPQAFFVATQPRTAALPSVAGLRSYYSLALHLREDPEPPLKDLLPAWLTLHGRLGNAVSLAAAPFHAPFMFGEHRYATAFGAAEALVLRLAGGRDKPTRVHQDRVAAVNAAMAKADTPADVREWASDVLKGANRKTLPRLIDELVASVGDVGADIAAAAPQFGRAAADLRNSVAHGGRHDLDSARRHWHGQALLWAVRVRLLHEAGVPLAVLAERARRTPAFKQILAGLVDPEATADA